MSEPRRPSPETSEALRAKRHGLETRALVLRGIRELFHQLGFLEVETPVRLRTPAMEAHIDAEPAGARWLRTSPELHCKRLLAAGYEKVYTLGPCFRQNELGGRHHPEFTMLEWYRARAGYRDILDDTLLLLRRLAPAGIPRPGHRIDTHRHHEITVSDAFLQFADWDPCRAFDEERFERDLLEKVEPSLPRDAPVVLIDYPRECAALARCKEEPPHTGERWELYLDGVEIANAYGELTDPAEQRRRFEEWAALRASEGRKVYPLDEPFLAALASGLPPCAGIALGVDRLAMILAGATTLDEVIAFRE
ncbi:MAG: EF-P lysine aminoacylase EpmA [Kiritimatiellia bacterium]